jgi:hypothetical protein
MQDLDDLEYSETSHLPDHRFLSKTFKYSKGVVPQFGAPNSRAFRPGRIHFRPPLASLVIRCGLVLVVRCGLVRAKSHWQTWRCFRPITRRWHDLVRHWQT